MITSAPDSPQKRGTYGSHRQRQQRRILEAAEKLFDERGIDRVTVAEIVTAAGIRPSTLYEYFSNKDDVVWAIVADLFDEAAQRAAHAMDGAGTALARIEALLHLMAAQLSDDAGKVRFMAEFDAMYARHWPAERLLTLERQLSIQNSRYLRDLVAAGIADGSLRPDLDPGLTMHAVINAVIGAQRRLASLGSKIEVEYGRPADLLFAETIRIILLGLSAPGHQIAQERSKPPRSRQNRKKDL